MIESNYSGFLNSYDEAISCNSKNYRINFIKDEKSNLYSNNIMTFVSKVPPGKTLFLLIGFLLLKWIIIILYINIKLILL